MLSVDLLEKLLLKLFQLADAFVVFYRLVQLLDLLFFSARRTPMMRLRGNLTVTTSRFYTILASLVMTLNALFRCRKRLVKVRLGFALLLDAVTIGIRHHTLRSKSLVQSLATASFPTNTIVQYIWLRLRHVGIQRVHSLNVSSQQRI